MVARYLSNGFNEEDKNGDLVNYEDYARLVDAVRYLRNLCEDKDSNVNTVIGALSGIMYVFEIER